jgi:hypothetical protein
MIKCLKDTGFRWPQKPPNASEVKFNKSKKQFHSSVEFNSFSIYVEILF